MTDIIHVIRVLRLGGYRLKLWFSDGQAGEWDFSDLAHETGPMVEPFKDPAYFSRVFVEFGGLTCSLTASTGALEALHADMAAAGALSFRGQRLERVAI